MLMLWKDPRKNLHWFQVDCSFAEDILLLNELTQVMSSDFS